MSSELSYLHKVKPPPALSKETVGVWNGWLQKGDKEVAREAAAKGLHIKLAITFLADRKGIGVNEAETWFKNEVIRWAYELLERKQFFRALHILNNAELDSGCEISQVFYSTSSKDLREYIGNQLLKAEKLDENMKQLWEFLELIYKNSDLFESSLEIESLEYLNDLPSDKKAEIASILFLNTEDNRVTPFLTPETLWNHLLVTNDLRNLLIWINIKFNSEFEDLIESTFLDQFKKFPITPEMLGTILSSEFNQPLKNDLYNELSKYGIFSDSEKDDVVMILKRLKDSGRIANLFEILPKNSSVLTVREFMEILVDHCLDNDLFSILNVCVENFIVKPAGSKHLEVIRDFRQLVRRFDEDSLRRNVLSVARVLGDDLVQYFDDNPVMLLALILFTKDADIVELITRNSVFTVNDVSLNQSLKNVIEVNPILRISCDKFTGKFSKPTVTAYELITKHLRIDSEILFEFRFKNTELPHFNNEQIVAECGYSKTVSYKFYLKQARPCVAANFFKKNLVRGEDLVVAEKKAGKVAILNFDCDDIAAACVVFVEMIGGKSIKLRVLLKAAKILSRAGYTKEYVQEVLLNSDDEPYNLQNLLETIVMNSIEFNSFASGAELVQALDVYEIVVQYSKISNIKLPELFLRHCASNNLWLPFLIFIQIHDYQLDQVKLMLQFFKNPTLIEHLEHGIVQDIQVEEKHALMMDRDSRKYFLSKVGIKRSLEGRGLNLSQSLKSRESQESEDGSANSDFFEIDIYNFKATLLQTLIRCHNSTDPPKALLQACQLYRNPLLAIFATSYEPDSVITNWLTWLAVSCELCQAFTNYESTAISGIAVTHLLENCLRDKFPKAILESFQIFLPENPLKPFVELVNNLLNFELNSSILEANLDSFRALTSGLRKNCILSENDHEMTYLSNRIWIETTALRLLSAVLDCNCSSVYQEIIIVDALVKLKISDYFSITSPNFENILEILKALHEINTDLRLDFDVVFDCKNSRHAIVNCINSLLDNNNYEAALKIARIEGLPPDLILIKEWQFKMNNESDLNFWTNCDKVFDENGVTADCVIDFYTDCVERISDTFDKFTVLKLAWQWAARFDLTCQYELEKKMWLSYLHLDEKQKDLKIFDLTPQVCLYKDLVEMLENVNEYDGELSKDLMRQMERVVLLVLNKSNFWLALKLQKMFGCQNTDLETLKLCHSLAEGILMPYQLDAQQRLLLSNIQYLRSYSHRRTFLSTRLSSLSSSTLSLANSSLAPTSDAPDSATNDVLTILKLLVEHLHNGTEIGQNVFMTYRISVNIEIPYQIVVVTSDCMQILRDALGDDCMNKLDVVHDFVSVYKWTKEEVADFICEELINATTRYIEFSIDQLIMWDVNINHDFQLVLQLLQDNCSILGNKIYSYAKTLHKSHLESLPHLKPADLALIVELIIKSHDCFTADCNMEGISTILKISKEIVLQLLVLQCWKLIVRLLTGVGRYTEMNYVFQILKENDQFEYLLRKNVRKDNSLKVALLEYLQKFCPDNHDLYKIVALHFTLFSEVAALWEKEAENVVMNLIGIAKLEMQNDKLNLDEEPFILFQNNEGTRICLNKLITSNIKHIKKDFTYDFLHRWLGTGLLTSDGEKWQVRRKILTSSFHFNILQNFVPIFNEETDFLVKILEEECENGSTNVVPLVSQFALKTIAETSMGTKLKFDSEKERNYKKAINDIVQVFMHRLFRPWLIPIFFYIFFPTYYQERRLVKTLHNFTEEVIEDREKNFQEISEGTNPKKRRLAMLDLLLSAKLIDGSIDQEGIREEVDTFMFEGHDTTTTAISFALMLLACHPEVQDEILKETIEILGDDLKKKPSLQDLQDMRYLERCIKEVLRLYPSVYFIGRKLGEDMTTFTGYKLKKNTSVVMQIYGMHHSPEIYEDPEKFDPDRFLPENCQNRHPFAYIPFSAGPRNCIGQRFALLEVKAVICGIVRNFVLEPVDTPKTVVLTADIILRTKFGIRVKFKRRV